jgi:hypothetical protein
MTTRIGWTLTRPKERRPGDVGGGLALFRYLRIDTDAGHGRVIVVGMQSFNREDLERLRDKGVKLNVDVVGVLRFTSDVNADLVEATIGQRRVVGLTLAPNGVREVL